MQKRADADLDFDQSLAWVDQKFTMCQDQLKSSPTCVDTGATAKGQAYEVEILVTPQGVFGRTKTRICDVLRPLAGLQHPYFFMGGSVTGGAGMVAQGGVDFVFDLWNEQAAAFTYKGGGVQGLIGVEANAYAGYGFGNKPNVIDAWSGEFVTGSASVGTPLAHVSAGGSVFSSPDGTIWGGAFSVGAGISVDTPLELGVTDGQWAAWNRGTRSIPAGSWLVRYTVEDVDGKEYIQYAGARDMALAMLWKLGPQAGAPVATQILAIAALKKTGLTIEQMCPDTATVAAAKPPVLPSNPGSGGAPGSSGGPPGGGGSSGGPSAGDAGPGDGASDAPPILDHCFDREDGVYCSELQPFSAILCKNHSIAGGFQCPSQGQKCVGPNGPGSSIVCN